MFLSFDISSYVAFTVGIIVQASLAESWLVQKYSGWQFMQAARI